jgi:hypothetical protein
MGIVDFFRSLFGRKSDACQAAIIRTEVSSVDDASGDEMVSSTAAATYAKRDQFWATIGTVEPDVIAFLINPQFRGEPAWPGTRQAYRVIRRPRSIIIASDGLSDPFDDVAGMGNGFEMELFIETPDIPKEMAGLDGNVAALGGSWAFVILKHVCAQIAEAGGIRQKLEKLDVLSMELPGVSGEPALLKQLPKEFISADDCIGILIGGPKPDFLALISDMPLSPVLMVPVVLLTAAELDVVRCDGAAGPKTVVANLSTAGIGHVSRLGR